MKWGEINLGELVDVKHGFAFKSRYFATEGKYILLTPGNCHEKGGLKLKGDKEKYYTGDVPDGYLLQKGDLVVVMTDLVNTAPILGGSFLIPEDDRYLHNQRLGLVEILDPKRINKLFAYYLLNTRPYRSQVRGSATGATVRHTSPTRIRSCKLKIPLDVTYQKKVADVLSAYDELIENNRRRMALLEDAARQLYREWFVRLRFPGHEHTRILDGVPEGWKRTTLGDLCTAVREVVKPEAFEPEMPYIGLEHIPRRSIALSKWGTAEQVTSSKHRFKAGDVIFGKIRPYFHKVGIAFVDGVASSDAIVIRANNSEHTGFILMTTSSDQFVAETAQTMKEGAKMPRADWKQMQAYSAPLPPGGLLGTFEATIKPIVLQLKTLTFANKKLHAARDLLLPRLISGEIAV